MDAEALQILSLLEFKLGVENKVGSFENCRVTLWKSREALLLNVYHQSSIENKFKIAEFVQKIRNK